MGSSRRRNRRDDAVVVRMTREEAQRLCFAISAGYEASRARSTTSDMGSRSRRSANWRMRSRPPLGSGDAKISVPLEPGWRGLRTLEGGARSGRACGRGGAGDPAP
jgi:hypothetical protein